MRTTSIKILIIMTCFLLISCASKSKKPEDFNNGKYIYDETISNDIRFKIYSESSNFFSEDDIIVLIEYEYIGDSDSITYQHTPSYILCAVTDEDKTYVINQGTDLNTHSTTLAKNQIHRLILNKGMNVGYDDTTELETLKTFKLDKGTYNLSAQMKFLMEDQPYSLECSLSFTVND